MKTSRISVLLLLILLFVSINRFMSLPSGVLFKDELPIVLVTLLVSLLITYLPREDTHWMKRRYLTITNIFLLSFLIVHFQDYLDLLVIPNSEKRFTTYVNHYVTVKAAYISLLGAISFCLGLCISKTNNALFHSNKSILSVNFRKLRNYSTILYFVFLIVFIAVNGRTYLAGAYSQETLDNMSGTLGTYIVIMLSACSLTTVLSVSLRLSERRQSLSLRQYLASFSPFFYLCVAVYLFFVISFGDRGPVISTVMTFAGGYFIASKKRVGALSLIVLLIVFATFISVWGVMRADRESGASVSETTEELYSNEQTISPATAELAGSNRVTIMAIESTPSFFPYRYGLFTLNNLLSIIPFSSSILSRLGIYIPKNLAHSSAFMNWYDHGDRQAAGVGTTTVADIYLDFGWVGVIVVMMLLGLLFRKIDSSVYAFPVSKLSPFLLITFMVLFSQAVYIPRSVTLFQLRIIIWDYAIFMLLCIVARIRVS